MPNSSQKFATRYASGSGTSHFDRIEPSSANEEDGSTIYAQFRASRAILYRNQRIPVVEGVLARRKHPARLGCAVPGRCEGHFRAAKHHIVDRRPPNETKNQLATAVRIDDEPQLFVG